MHKVNDHKTQGLISSHGHAHFRVYLTLIKTTASVSSETSLLISLKTQPAVKYPGCH